MERSALDSIVFVSLTLCFCDFLVRLKLDLLELVSCRQRLLLRRYFRFDSVVENLGELKVDDIELINEDVSFLQFRSQLVFDVVALEFPLRDEFLGSEFRSRALDGFLHRPNR